MAGTLKEIDRLEQEVKRNPASPLVGQMRFSIMRHMNKIQGGRFNEEINKMEQGIVPGNEGFSIPLRLGELVAPGLMKDRFDILRSHVQTTGNAPPNPEYAQ